MASHARGDHSRGAVAGRAGTCGLRRDQRADIVLPLPVSHLRKNDHSYLFKFVKNVVKLEHHAQSVDDALIGGLSYKLKAGASYVTNRRSVSCSASGGNQYSPSGVKVCRFNITSDHWMDPSIFRVMFQLNNKGHTGAENVTWVEPLSWNPAVFFRRARIIAGGQVIEDIDDFNRLSLMLNIS